MPAGAVTRYHLSLGHAPHTSSKSLSYWSTCTTTLTDNMHAYIYRCSCSTSPTCWRLYHPSYLGNKQRMEGIYLRVELRTAESSLPLHLGSDGFTAFRSMAAVKASISLSILRECASRNTPLKMLDLSRFLVGQMVSLSRRKLTISRSKNTLFWSLRYKWQRLAPITLGTLPRLISINSKVLLGSFMKQSLMTHDTICLKMKVPRSLDNRQNILFSKNKHKFKYKTLVKK